MPSRKKDRGKQRKAAKQNSSAVVARGPPTGTLESFGLSRAAAEQCYYNTMPSRKKDRGKQRKAAKQSSHGPVGVRLSPREIQRNRNIGPAIKELLEEGCCVVRHDDGSSTIRHPCFKLITGNVGLASAKKAIRNFDRGLLNRKERQELAANFINSFSPALREGNFSGTDIIMRNVADPHVRPHMGPELAKANIHLTFLQFMNRSDKSISDVLGREITEVGESAMLSFYWATILGFLMQDGLAEDARDSARLQVAREIGPFVMRMIDGKRELFQSNVIWHICISPFFDLVRGIMMSKDGFLVMISYEGFLPFVAQASCWSQSREDIASESESLCQLYPDPMTEPLSSTCHEAQKILALTMHEHYGIPEDVMRGVLDQTACTPLLSDDPNCNESTMVGLIRMLDKSSNRAFLFECILEPLLLKHGYVDARVTAELIEFGKGNQSLEVAKTVLNLMVAILGRDNSYEHIKRIDSRYAAALRYGLLEFCIDALVTYGDQIDCTIGNRLGYLSCGLYCMAMHSKTSRALRQKKAQTMGALDALRHHSTASRSHSICSLIEVAIDMSAPATCCNCLKEVNRKDLLFCRRCGVECYCSSTCQSESYALGHEGPCKEFAKHSDSLREGGLSETELKRLEVLKRNLMMNGCRIVQEKAAEFLDGVGGITEARIDFGHCPPDVEVFRSDEGESSNRLKCTFIAPVYYGFAEKVDLEESVLKKFISRRSLER